MANLEHSKPNLLSLIVKAFQIRFAGLGGGTGGGQSGWWEGVFNNSRVNFASEAGRPTQSSLVMAAVNWVGRVLPEAPLQVVEADAKGKESPIIGHPAAQLLRRPNPYYSGATLWKTFALHWLTAGNVYLVKVRNSYGQVIELWPIAPLIQTANWYLPATMFPRWPENGSEFISYYEYLVEGRSNRVEVEDVIHFRDGCDPANMGRTGLACITPVLREICTDNEVPMYQYLLLKSGGAPPVVLALKDGQSGVDVDLKQVKSNYINATSGDNRGRVFVSGNAVELTKVGFSPAEMNLKVLRHLSESRFASVTGIAKETLGFGAADENSTYNNVQQADERSIQSFIRPLWNYIEDELTHQLGPDFGLKPSQRFDFDLSEVAALQEDHDAIHARASTDLASGGITVNEYREAISLPAVPDGNVYLRSSSIQAVTPEMVDKQIQDALNPPEPTPQQFPINTGNAQLSPASPAGQQGA